MHNFPGFPPIAHEPHDDMMEASKSKWGLTTVMLRISGLFCMLNLYLQWNADIRPLLQLHIFCGRCINVAPTRAAVRSIARQSVEALRYVCRCDFETGALGAQATCKSFETLRRFPRSLTQRTPTSGMPHPKMTA